MVRVLLVNSLLVLGVLAAFEASLYALMSRDRPMASETLNRVAFKLYWRTLDLIQFLPDCAKHDPELLYTLRPGHCVFQNIGFRTDVAVNSLGLRDDEASLDSPEIVAIGDSFTMGWGVEERDAFPAILEDETGMHVLNAGISSYGTAREIGMLARIDTSEVKVLIVQYCGNNDDFENRTYLQNGRALSPRSEADYEATVVGERTAHYYPLRYAATGASILFGSRQNSRSPNRNGIDQSSENDVDRFLDVLTDARVSSNRPILVLLEQSLNGTDQKFAEKVLASSYLDPLKERYASVLLVDTQDVLGTTDFLFPDGHTNSVGHRKIADAVLEALRSSEFELSDTRAAHQ